MAQPVVPAATKGEPVVVDLRDGRSITGAVGEWADTLGFQIMPTDRVPCFIRVSDPDNPLGGDGFGAQSSI